MGCLDVLCNIDNFSCVRLPWYCFVWLKTVKKYIFKSRSDRQWILYYLWRTGQLMLIFRNIPKFRFIQFVQLENSYLWERMVVQLENLYYVSDARACAELLRKNSAANYWKDDLLNVMQFRYSRIKQGVKFNCL